MVSPQLETGGMTNSLKVQRFFGPASIDRKKKELIKIELLTRYYNCFSDVYQWVAFTYAGWISDHGVYDNSILGWLYERRGRR